MASIFAFQNDLKKGEDVQGLIRHVVLSSILSYKKKYGTKYGAPVIACDGGAYWRKGVFPYYKAGRKKAREESGLDWDTIFKTLDEIRDAIDKDFPWKLVRVNEAEADDVIAVLTQSTQEFGQYEDVMIISSDKDFKQLHQYDNVKQFNPVMKKQVTINKSEIRAFMIEHIVKGDKGDGVPNILSDDDVFMTEGRQNAVSAKRLAEFIDQGELACRDTVESRRWERNERLVSFTKIPEEISAAILAQYVRMHTGDKNGVMNYLISKRCRNLLNSVDEF